MRPREGKQIAPTHTLTPPILIQHPGSVANTRAKIMSKTDKDTHLIKFVSKCGWREERVIKLIFNVCNPHKQPLSWLVQRNISSKNNSNLYCSLSRKYPRESSFLLHNQTSLATFPVSNSMAFSSWSLTKN